MAGGALYDRIGDGYAAYRQPDPAIMAMILDALGDAQSVIAVGAGTGSYEPADRSVVAVEPSSVMIAQRAAGAAPCVKAGAEALPFRVGAFDAALATLTVHHWPDPLAGLAEMRRVAARVVVLTFDPVAHGEHWLTDYVPELAAWFGDTPALDDIVAAVGAREVIVVPVAHNTPDGMTIAYWRRPEAYLDPARRAGCSALQLVDPVALDRGLQQLESDLESGAWRARYAALLGKQSMDYGLRLVVS